jgi:hypothetical protein
MTKVMNTEVLNEKPVQMLLFPPQITHGLSCEIRELVISKPQQHNER